MESGVPSRTATQASRPDADRQQESVFLQRPPMLVIGASARAAARSANQAGFPVHAIDLFGDTDLRDLADTHATVDSLAWPDCRAAVSHVLERLPPDPLPLCLPSGGMEHQVETLTQLSRRTHFLGPDPQRIALLRSPWILASWARACELHAPELREEPNLPDQPWKWLLKDSSRSGGLGIIPGRRWRDRHRVTGASDLVRPPAPDGQLELRAGQYWQRRVSGYDASVVGLACKHQVQWLGATRQWSGNRRLGAPPFLYSGSFGPIALPDDLWPRLTRLAEHAISEAGLQGPFGIDLRIDGPRCWILELNPRYPAGAEVLERASGVSLCQRWQQHMAGVDLASPWPPRQVSRTWAKAILYASARGPRRVSAGGMKRLISHLRKIAIEVADVPPTGSLVPQRSPIFTLLASFPSPRAAVVGFMRVRNLCETLVFAPI